jgi:hypothetical protein
MPTRGNNKFGRAGKGSIRADTLAAFFDHYTYEGSTGLQGVPRWKLINGHRVRPDDARAFRRWRNGHTSHVAAATSLDVLGRYGFDLAWFHGWCKLHRKKLTD